MSKNSHRRRKRKQKQQQLKILRNVVTNKNNDETFFRHGDTVTNSWYKKIRDSKHPSDSEGRELCNKLWELFKPHSDEHFLIEASIDFAARFWEMDLTVSLIEQGLNVVCPKPGPDICLKNTDQNVWIEAISPNKGCGVDEVPEVKESVAHNVPNDKIILRYTSAIAEKFTKYERYIKKKIISEDEPYVIAINGCQIPYARPDFDPPRIVRSVFPIGPEYVSFSKKSLKTVDNGFQFRKSVKKEIGTDIMINHFTEPKFSGISAILFSCSDCFNRPEEGNDWVMVHNPYAKNPLVKEWITCDKEYTATLSDDSYTLKCKTAEE